MKKKTTNANIGMTDAPARDKRDVDVGEVDAYPSSSEANPTPEEVREQREWVSERGENERVGE